MRLQGVPEEKPRVKFFPARSSNGFAFDVELLLLAKKLGFKIVDLPVRWVNSPESKVNIVLDSLQMLRDARKGAGGGGADPA